MQWPLREPETLFEELWQDLPAATVQMARGFNAFVRARTVTTPVPLLRVGFFYCGWDTPWRAGAGTWTALDASRPAQAVAERLRAGGPGVHARLRRLLPLAVPASLPTGWRLVVLDASRLQAPGATGTDPRRPSAMAWVSWPCLEVLGSDVHTGATLHHCTLAPGDGVVAARGYAQCPGMSPALQQGAALLGRLHPLRVGLHAAGGAPVALCTVWNRQTMAPRRTLPVVLHAAGGLA